MNEYILYTTYDLPIPYKAEKSKEVLKFYPVTLKDYILFNLYAQAFTFEKNHIPDKKIISMTNLQYIYHITQEDLENPLVVYFDRVLSIALKEDESFKDIETSIRRYTYDESGKPQFLIGDTQYKSKDYENIKKIICEQNMVELPDENMSKEVRDSLEKAREYKRRLSKTKPATLEEYIISLSLATGWSIEYIYDMSIRKFITAIQRMDNLIHYKIYLAASMSGMVEFKDKSFIKHWLTSLEEEDKYKDVAVDYEEIQKKVLM